MKLRSIDIACSDLSSSALFYIGLLELDVLDSSDEYIELSDGINLLSSRLYEERTGVLPTKERNRNIVLTFELESFDKFLYKLYKCEYTIDYNISIQNGKRVLSFLDPDRNTILLKECDDNRKRKSYEMNIVSPEEIIKEYSTTYIFKEEKDSQS